MVTHVLLPECGDLDANHDAAWRGAERSTWKEASLVSRLRSFLLASRLTQQIQRSRPGMGQALCGQRPQCDDGVLTARSHRGLAPGPPPEAWRLPPGSRGHPLGLRSHRFVSRWSFSSIGRPHSTAACAKQMPVAISGGACLHSTKAWLNAAEGHVCSFDACVAKKHGPCVFTRSFDASRATISCVPSSGRSAQWHMSLLASTRCVGTLDGGLGTTRLRRCCGAVGGRDFRRGRIRSPGRCRGGRPTPPRSGHACSSRQRHPHGQRVCTGGSPRGSLPGRGLDSAFATVFSEGGTEPLHEQERRNQNGEFHATLVIFQWDMAGEGACSRLRACTRPLGRCAPPKARTNLSGAMLATRDRRVRATLPALRARPHSLDDEKPEDKRQRGRVLRDTLRAFLGAGLTKNTVRRRGGRTGDSRFFCALPIPF